MGGSRREGVAGRLDGERILEAARRVVAEEGASRLTMRRIGAELGTDPTAIYRHFASKDDLVAGLADVALRSIAGPDRHLPWQLRLRGLLRTLVTVYADNPALVGALARQGARSAGKRRIAALTLSILAEAGLDERDRPVGYHVLVSYAVGLGVSLGRERPAGPATDDFPAPGVEMLIGALERRARREPECPSGHGDRRPPPGSRSAGLRRLERARHG